MLTLAPLKLSELEEEVLVLVASCYESKEVRCMTIAMVKHNIFQHRSLSHYTHSPGYHARAPTCFVHPPTLYILDGTNKSLCCHAAGRSPRYVTNPLCSAPSIHALQSMPVEVAPLCMLFSTMKLTLSRYRWINKEALNFTNR